jgi:hypothetical protein
MFVLRTYVCGHEYVRLTGPPDLTSTILAPLAGAKRAPSSPQAFFYMQLDPPDTEDYWYVGSGRVFCCASFMYAGMCVLFPFICSSIPLRAVPTGNGVIAGKGPATTAEQLR